jgi:hypothetical protein
MDGGCGLTCHSKTLAAVCALPACLAADLVILNNIPYFIAAATLGLAVNFLSNLIIKLSSATTVKLLAAVRGPLVVLSGMLLFAEMVGGGVGGEQ